MLTGIGDGCTFTVAINRRTAYPFRQALKGPASEPDTPTWEPLTKEQVSVHNQTSSITTEGEFVISGTLSNHSGTAIVGAQITYSLYSETGALLGQASTTNDQYFGPERSTWQFKATVSADALGGEYPAEIALEAIEGFPIKPRCTSPSPFSD